MQLSKDEFSHHPSLVGQYYHKIDSSVTKKSIEWSTNRFWKLASCTATAADFNVFFNGCRLKNGGHRVTLMVLLIRTFFK